MAREHDRRRLPLDLWITGCKGDEGPCHAKKARSLLLRHVGKSADRAECKWNSHLPRRCVFKVVEKGDHPQRCLPYHLITGDQGSRCHALIGAWPPRGFGGTDAGRLTCVLQCTPATFASAQNVLLERRWRVVRSASPSVTGKIGHPRSLDVVERFNRSAAPYVVCES